jgi:hypothetical protein
MGIRYISERHIVIDDLPTPVPFWEPDQRFEDQTIVVLGGGVSHVEVDLGLLRDFGFIAVNSACRKVGEIAKERDILYFSDNSWSERYEELIKSWKGICVTSNRNTKARLGSLVNRLDLQNLTEFMQIKSDYVQASSGHTAVCLAVWLGAKKIVLIGFECKAINGKTHGHDDYVQGDLNAFRERFIPGWVGLSQRFKNLGVDIINSTPDSEVKEFRYLSFKEALGYV